MSTEFLINEDPERGIKTVGWFLDDGRLHVQTRQYVPDSFFAHLDAFRQLGEEKKRGTQQHWRRVAIIPNALQDKLLVDSDGKPLQFGDPEREKKLRRLLNDGEYRKLRVSEGRV